MKLNLANPATGLQKSVEIDDNKKLLCLYERQMGAEVPVDPLGEEFKGYIFKITGGNDKQGFPMCQGVMSNGRVRLLFKNGMKCFRERKKGQRRRKSVRGIIVGPDISALNLVLVKKGENDIAGLTDGIVPKRKGPKRANNIRKLFNLSKNENVCKHVIRRVIEKDGKKKTKAPKVQRLITDSTRQRARCLKKKLRLRQENAQKSKEDYKKVLLDWKTSNAQQLK